MTDAIINPMPGINDGLTAGVRDSAERLFLQDGAPTDEELARLANIDRLGNEFGVDTNTEVAP